MNRETAAPSGRGQPGPGGGRPARARPAPAGSAALPSAAGGLAVSPSTCSANVAAGQAGLSQMRRRTSSSTRTGRPPQARSCRQRRYRSCTRTDSVPQPRQATGPEPVRATIFHAAAQVLHAIEVQPAQMREQQVQQAGFPAGQLVQHNRLPRSLVMIKILAIQIVTERPFPCTTSYEIASLP